MALLERLMAPVGAEYKSLSEVVYQRLRHQILWGIIPAGSLLTVRSLAQSLSVSPMPVRDALQRLAADELVEISPRSSTRVAQISLRTTEEIFQLQRHLEPLAARLAAAHFTAKDIRGLKIIQGKLQQAMRADDAEAYHRWNQEFHFLIFRRAGNIQLERIAQNLWNRNFTHFSARAVKDPTLRNRRAEEHRRIIRAFEKRDGDAVEEAWRDHIVQSGTETVEHLRRLLPATAADHSRHHTNRA
jgi:DNA-binding GntR family transcriptional regulator